MKFEIVSEIEQVETIAIGKSIRVLSLLNEKYGKGRWRKFASLKFIGTKPMVSADGI